LIVAKRITLFVAKESRALNKSEAASGDPVKTVENDLKGRFLVCFARLPRHGREPALFGSMRRQNPQNLLLLLFRSR
jgi:hypothetical protein